MKGIEGKVVVYIHQMQRELLELPSLQTNTFSIDYSHWTSLSALLAALPSDPLSAASQLAHRRELSKFVFIFRICFEHSKWQLHKKFTDLLTFQHSMVKKYGKELPSFPLQRESELSLANVEQAGEFLGVFMKRAVNIAFYDEEVQHFLDILPEKLGHGVIYGEYELRKQSGGRYNEVSCCVKLRNTLCPCARSWRTRSFTITDNGVFYSKRRKTFEIRDMLLFCHRFKLLCGNKETDDQLGIVLLSATRRLTLEAKNVSDFVLFLTALREALRNCPFAQPQRFDSFAPVHKECLSKFYVDGEGYFSDLCDQLLSARKYVYITGWMITPYFLLKRPAELDDRRSRLDYVLEEIASRGVKVHIILYQEPEIAINNDSEFVERYLEDLSPNIRVIRHPKYVVIPFLWSHHEKSVLIDQKVAFLGGLDICYGRWDNPKHPLTNETRLWQGADFCNLRISDIYTPRNFLMSNLDHRTQPRMPWHDIAIQIRGSSVHDLARHFTSYWNFVNFQTKFDDRELLSLAGRQTHHPKTSNKVLPTSRKGTEDIDGGQLDQMVEEQYYSKYLQERVVKFMSLELPTLHTLRQNIRNYPRKLISRIRDQTEDECLLVANEQEPDRGRHSHQLLRSASTWSQGLLEKEQSIHTAYLHLIETAEHFIYIENQFFICKENLIVEKLAERITKAHKQGKAFKVVVLLPLLPGFEGDVREENSAVMRIQLHWEYWTISRSSRSLLKRLKHIPHPKQYLQFFGLRQHASTREGLPLTEILYIHSKLIIVDDRRVLIGSANINDRSLLGDRDSELAIHVEDQDLRTTPHGYSVSKDIQKLRMDLYMEHFGLTEQQAENFLDEEIWELISSRASNNTRIYREVFGCYPDDTMEQYGDIEEVKKRSHGEKYLSLRDDIVGHAVEVPLKFLEKEDLNLSAKEKEFFLPNIFFT